MDRSVFIPEAEVSPLFVPGPVRPRCAVLLSGVGSNAVALLRRAVLPDSPFKVEVLVTDAPETSAARRIGRDFGLPVEELDIRRFYRERGEASIKLDSPRRRELREEWSAMLLAVLQRRRTDFVILAGFVPLTNVAAHLPCLNVHPGDLTLANENGGRLLAGLHFLPVEKAILLGHAAIRSSVILVQPYTGSGRRELDSGPVLGISSPLPVDPEGLTPEELRAIAAARTSPPFRDRLRELAAAHVERLKRRGDHVVLPGAAADFAMGNFGTGRGRLCFRTPEGWRQITTVEYAASGRDLVD